ncbi:MAG: hypothetical protein U1E73_13395 [Planctomycetota bacterium]
MNPFKIPGGFDELFRQITPVFLLGVLLVTVFEPWVPGTAWLKEHLGDNVVLRACVAACLMYVLLLWGESLRLNAMLTAVLKAFREQVGGDRPAAGRNPKARLEAAKLLVAALGSDDAEIRATSRHNLTRLAGKDLGAEPGPWQRWLREQEQIP